MKEFEVFKDKSLGDIFDEEDKVIKVMLPSPITPSAIQKLVGAKTSSFGFLYKGFPIFFDKTVFHVKKEDKKFVDEIIAKVKVNEEVSLLSKVKNILRKK